MKYRSIFSILCPLAIAGCADGPSLRTAPAERIELSQVTLDAETARAEINRYRASRGLGALKTDAHLTEAAQRHSDDLAIHDRISHRGSDDTNPWDRVKNAGYKARLAAENVGVGQRSFGEVLQGWKDSPGHNKNLLLPDATQMGIALVINPASRNQTFWTLVMGTPARAKVASTQGR